MMKLVLSLALAFLLLPAAGSGAAEAEQKDAGLLFAVAQLYRFQGLYDDALSSFEKAVAADPNDPYFHLEYGEFLFQLGRLEEAAEQVEIAQGAASSSREALRLSGRIQLRLGERSVEALDRASDIFEQLRALDPLDIEVRVTLGRLHLNRSRPAAAADALREAREMRPGDRLISSLLVEALGQLPPESGILQELRELVESDASFLQPRLALARALSSSGDQAAVVDLLEAAPEAVRSNVEYLRLLAFAYYRTGRHEDSLETSGEWLERRPDDRLGRYLRALTLVALDRGSDAEDLLTALIDENPENEEFALALAEVLEREGRSSDAAASLRRLRESMLERGDLEGSRRVTAFLADVYARAERWEELLALAQAELGERDGGDQETYRLLQARALREMGRDEQALEALDALGETPLQENRVAARRAEILFSLDRGSEAEQLVGQLVAAEDVESLMLAAEVFHNVELFERAVPVLSRAEEIDPGNLEVLFWLGASYERAGRMREAEREFRRLLARDENFAPALNYLGYMWADRGENLDEALALVQRAVALEPNNGAYLDSLGWTYFRSGRLDEAREPLERAVRLVQTDPIVFEHLGDLYSAIGRAAEAETAYRKALELGAENANEIRRKLGESSDR